MKRRAVVLCLVAAACGGGSLEAAPCETGHCATQASTRRTYQSSIDRKVDVLFVVDDTPAMAPLADALPARFAEIAQALINIPPSPPISFHAGFIRSGGCDATTRGGACGITAPEQFLRAEWCETITNGTLAIADTFACLGDLGAVDCGPAQPLTAALRLLSSPRAGWEGFLRPDAYLLIVVVAAQDDASGSAVSLTAVADIVAGVKALKPDPSEVAVSVITPQGGCATRAVPTPRLVEFAQAFGSNGLLMSLCDATFTPVISILDRQINSSLLPPCLADVRDTDPQTPGLQAECTVVSSSRNPDGTQTTSVLPSCDVGAPPCWRLGTACKPGAGGSWVLSVDEPPDWCAEAGTNVTIECLACADQNDPACAVPTQ